MRIIFEGDEDYISKASNGNLHTVGKQYLGRRGRCRVNKTGRSKKNKTIKDGGVASQQS